MLLSLFVFVAATGLCASSSSTSSTSSTDSTSSPLSLRIDVEAPPSGGVIEPPTVRRLLSPQALSSPSIPSSHSIPSLSPLLSPPVARRGRERERSKQELRSKTPSPHSSSNSTPPALRSLSPSPLQRNHGEPPSTLHFDFKKPTFLQGEIGEGRLVISGRAKKSPTSQSASGFVSRRDLVTPRAFAPTAAPIIEGTTELCSED